MCKPCAFIYTEEGCENGMSCVFCHLCPQGEKKRRQKEKKAHRKAMKDIRELRRAERTAVSIATGYAAVTMLG